VTSVTCIGTDSTPIIQETNLYDLAGRQTSHSDALNRPTGIAETFDTVTGHRTRKTTNSDGGTLALVPQFEKSDTVVTSTCAF